MLMAQNIKGLSLPLPALGIIQGRIGFPKEAVEVGGSRRKTKEARRERQRHLLALRQKKRTREDPGDPSHQGIQCRLAGSLRHKDKLIASQPAKKIALPQGFSQARRDLPEHSIPRRMSPGVIDWLEIIEVKGSQDAPEYAPTKTP